MDDPRLTLWETLFRHALDIIDEAARAGHRLGDWTFGGGTGLLQRKAPGERWAEARG